MPDRNLQCRRGADRLPNQHSLLDAGVVENGEDVPRELEAVVLVQLGGRAPEAAQVECHDRVPARAEVRGLLPPGGVVAAGAVHEQHGRALAVNLVVDLGPV